MSDEIIRKKILIVEDEEKIRRVIRKTLENKFDIEEAADGWEAIQKTEEDFDLIILDIVMPGLSGHTAFTALDTDLENASLETSQAPPTLVLTALPKTDDRVQQILDKENSAGYIQKPFSPSHLLKMVKQVLSE